MEAEGYELQKPWRNKIHGHIEFGSKRLEGIKVYACAWVVPTVSQFFLTAQGLGSLFELR